MICEKLTATPPEQANRFPLRLIFAMDVLLETSDKSHPLIQICGIKSDNLVTIIRDRVEVNRMNKRVFEVD